MAEYKLSYTGKEIDEKLGKIDKISVGDTKPTDEEVEIWINTSEEYDDSDSGGGNVNLTAESIADALGYTPANEAELSKKANTSDLGSLATKDTVAKTDLASSVQTSLNKADSALQSYTETDPTVPAWAKASTKPTYTASEVGADASGTASSLVSAHNVSTSAHADIREDIASLFEVKADKSEGAFFIEGSGTTDATAKTSTWIGTSDRITEYYDGLTIRYKIGIAGQSTVTLNINGLGAKTVYRFNTTKLTTQFPVGSIIHLVYHSDLNDGCWITNDYDANTNTYQRLYATTGNEEYPITTRYNTTTGEAYYAEYGRYSTGVTLNPSTNTITATTFKGKLTGNADTATKATQDASGNVIADTYETKEDVDAKFNLLSNEKVDKTALSLGIASDNLIYLFVDGSPVGTGIPQGTGETGDLFGYIDENNTVVLRGDLIDGNYTIKYEMDDGSTIDIGNLVLDTNVYYSITKNFTQCTINNSATQVIQGESYAAVIAANSGYELSSVVVTMGGVDITSTAVSGGNISIAEVIGDIVITAVAEAVQEVEPTNFFNSSETPAAYGRLGSDGTNRTDAPNSFASNYIPVQAGDIVEITGCTIAGISSGSNTYFMACYDSNKAKLYAGQPNGASEYCTVVTDSYESDFTNVVTVTASNVKYLRFTCSKYGYSDQMVDISQIVIKIKRNGAYL